MPFAPSLLAMAWLVSPAQALSDDDAQAILQIEAQRLPALALNDFIAKDDPATRARAARALGRLRTATALAPLKKLSEDADLSVRTEAAWALGMTPGAEHLILARLSAEQDPACRAALLDALGREGSPAALPLLIDSLGLRPDPLHPALQARAAARSLGRMGLRDLAEARNPQSSRALLDQRQRIDSRLRLDCAYALARLRLPDLDATQRADLLGWARDEPVAEVQVYLVRAAGNLSPGPDLDAVLQSAARDPDEGVRVATARAAATAGWAGVTALLSDADRGVRREALAAVAKVPGLDARALLLPVIEAGDDLEAAEDARTMQDPRLLDAAAALAALAEAGLLKDPGKWLEPARPTEIRVAAVDAVMAPARLLKLATEDGEPAVRTAAAGRLLAMDQIQPHDGRRMLDGFDEIVAAMAADWLVEHPDPATEGSLVTLLEEADEPSLVASCLRALKALYSRSGGRVRPPDTPLDPFLAPLFGHPDGAVRAAAIDLALALDLEAPAPWHALVTAPIDQLADVHTARVRTNRGNFIIELLPDEAPVTVWNFVQLSRSGFFDNLRFHRVVPDFVAQGGDPRGDGNGGPGWSIPDEPSPLSYEEGTLGMALSGPDTGGSQWFVTLSPQPHLDGTYPVFGRVLQGMQVVRALQPTDRILHIDIEGPVAARP